MVSSKENFTRAYIANVSVCPEMMWINNTRIRLKFKGSCLKQEDKAPFTPKAVINLFIVYELGTWSWDLNNDFALKNCLFGVAKLTKNPDPDNYKYSSYGIGFDVRSEFLLLDGSMGKNVVIFGVYMSSPVHIDDKKKRYFCSC